MARLNTGAVSVASVVVGSVLCWLVFPVAAVQSAGYQGPLDDAKSFHGSKIAFGGDRASQDEPDEIYVMNADGTGERQVTVREQLTFPPGCNSLYPRWSPDGKQIAFTCAYPQRGIPVAEIWLTDGTTMTQLTSMFKTTIGGIEYQGAVFPTWSPDGKQIAFVGLSVLNNIIMRQIFIINADGTDLRGPLITGNTPDWSANGQWLLFARSQTVYVIALDDLLNRSGNAIQLTNKDSTGNFERHGFDGGPRWAPDGRRIVFERALINEPNRPYVAVMNPGEPEPTSTPEQITTADELVIPHQVFPSWSPDGRWILFQRLLCDPTKYGQMAPNGNDLFAVAVGADPDGSHREVRLTSGACPGPPAPGEPFGTFVPQNSTFVPRSTFSAWASWAPGRTVQH